MNKNIAGIVVAALVVVTIGALGFVLFAAQSPDGAEQVPLLPPQPQPSPQPPAQNGTSSGQHTVAGGQLTFQRPDDFGLAISQEQILAESFIPPCEEGFDYCLYYNAPTYEGTNFDSAGLRIKQRDDIAAKEECLQTQPAGYSQLEPTIREMETYSTSAFLPLQNAATGHVSEGTLYRVSFDSSCFEFETRVATSQFANYEPGAIQEFTEQDKQAVEQKLHELLWNVRFVENPSQVIFP